MEMQCFCAILLLIFFKNIRQFECMLIGHASGVVDNVAPAVLSDAHHLTKRMDLEMCLAQFDVHKNTIIRTGESQAIGGKYIQGIELDTMEECQRLCCETESCDVYIFEAKHDGYCYLFECGPPENFHCKFTRHANYTSAVLTPIRHAPEITTPRPTTAHIATTTNISQQEMELANLKMKPETRQNEASSMNANGLQMTQQLQQLQQQQMGVQQMQQQVEAKAANVTHCGRFQFPCHSGECIAVYNACDGIPQCEDGSDEGPECNGMSSSATLPQAKVDQASLKVAAQPSSALPSYTSSIKQQQAGFSPELQLQNVQMQQQAQLQQQQQQPQQLISNREDPDAWINRKMIANNQMQTGLANDANSRIFSHKGGLQVATSYGNSNGNANINPMYAVELQHSNSFYMPPSPSQQQQRAPMEASNGLYDTQHVLLPANIMNWQATQQQQQQPIVTAGYVPQQQQQQQHQQVLLPLAPAAVPQAPAAQQQLVIQPQQQQTVAMPAAVASQPVPQQQATLVESPAKIPQPQDIKPKSQNNDEDDNYDDDDSTEPPKKKQRKHKQTSKTNDDTKLPAVQPPIQSTNSKTAGAAASAVAVSSSQPLSLPAAVLAPAASPVHEQYKIIHENLAMEFRDHDGYSERPSGALLSLTLGVLVAAALAILIGCRVRTVGRRARRLGGKQPYAHEADFLVNGMYL